MMDIKWWVFALVGAVVVFMVINRSVTQPLYWIWQGFLYSAIGGLVLFLINLVGQYVHFHINGKYDANNDKASVSPCSGNKTSNRGKAI